MRTIAYVLLWLFFPWLMLGLHLLAIAGAPEQYQITDGDI